MKIGIVDDEKQWLSDARSIVKKYYSNEDVCVDIYMNGEQLIKQSKEYDILFVDVEMEKMDGFETVARYKEIYPESIVIMFTMHIELSRKGYIVNAFRYIDKSNMSVEIPEALTAAEQLLGRNQKIQVSVVNLGSIILRLKDILFVETSKRNISVHTRTKDYICSDSIGDMESRLPSNMFFRCHKSYIVNLDAVKRFDNIYVYMIDNSKAMVSDRKYEELKRHYLERILERANG